MTRSSSMCLESFDDIVEVVDGAASLEVVLTIMDLDIYSFISLLVSRTIRSICSSLPPMVLSLSSSDMLEVVSFKRLWPSTYLAKLRSASAFFGDRKKIYIDIILHPSNKEKDW